MAKFPKTLFVKEEKDGADTYYVSSQDIIGMAEIGEKQKIGVYELVRMETVEGVVKCTPA